MEPELLQLYALGRSATEAAKESGRSLRTCARRWADEKFLREGDRLRSLFLTRSVGEAASRAAALASRAVEVMGQLLEHESAWVRLNTARALLESLSRFRQDVDFAVRVEQLEAQLERLEGTR